MLFSTVVASFLSLSG